MQKEGRKKDLQIYEVKRQDKYSKKKKGKRWKAKVKILAILSGGTSPKQKNMRGKNQLKQINSQQLKKYSHFKATSKELVNLC